jgi:DNA polymerase-3 subunit delta
MAVMSVSELNASLKSGKIERAYYFYGQDTAVLEQYTRQILSKTAGKDGEALSVHRFEGAEFKVGAFSDACETLPFMSEYVRVIIRDFSAGPRGKKEEPFDGDDLKALIKIISDLPASTVMIICNKSVDLSDEKEKKKISDKNQRLINAVAKVGAVCEFKYKSVGELAKDIEKKVSSSGSSISKETARRLAAVCGCDTMMVGNEIAKLLAYADGGEITAEMVDLLTPAKLESSAFDLAKAVAGKDGKNAVRLLIEFAERNVEPIMVLSAVAGNMIALYRAATAVASGKNAASVIADFRYTRNREFLVNNAFRGVRAYSMPHLRECLNILALSDVALKSTRTDNQVILEEAVVKCLTTR